MQLLTKEILKKLPPLYSQDGKEPSEVKVVVKFFGGGAYSFYVTEYDPIRRLFFGFATFDGSTGELGYVSQDELEAIRFPPFRLPIERDRYYEGTLEDVLKKHSY